MLFLFGSSHHLPLNFYFHFLIVLCGYITVPNKTRGKSVSPNHLELSKTPHLNSFKSTECLLLSLLHREIVERDESGTSETVSQKDSTAEKGRTEKRQHCAVGKNVVVREQMGGSCQNLSRLKYEQARLLTRKARCVSLEGIVDPSSSKSDDDRLKTLPRSGICPVSLAHHENQLLPPEFPQELMLDLHSRNTNQKETQNFKGVSASSVPDQDLYSDRRESKRLYRSRSLRGNTSSWCGVHAPVAEITVKPHLIVPLSQKSQSSTQVVAKLESKPGDSNTGISKRLCRSTTELSENTFFPNSFALTGTPSKIAFQSMSFFFFN